MKFLLDQDVYALTARFLIGSGHDAVSVAALGLSQAADSEILHIAGEQNRILVTRDRDFGTLVFVKELGVEVIYLRIPPLTLDAIHRELQRVLGSYSEDELRGAFVVVEPGRQRFRKIQA
ncbi:MAG: hypothetical protein BZY88_02010 [SAR202 cluster bacterium Io17-Chloro-G9]|nr:MAG: hypothetical protein BZY88_02010 [SAR202 cluster bacterium Io17-Chloro-G9]